ncbi:MAG: glycosyltransferase [Candidatus Aminicenantes bacterium]|nr:glycosyltransferase [Candidatus Aminicenantes bacterium]
MEKESPKVLFIVNWFYPDKDSPVNGIFNQKNARAISRFNKEICVLFINDKASLKKHYSISSAVEDNIFTVRSYFKRSRSHSGPAKGLQRIWAKLVLQVRYARALLRSFKTVEKEFGRPEIFHVNIIPPPVFRLVWLFKYRKTPVLFTEHLSDFLPQNIIKSRRSKIKDILLRNLINEGSGLVVPSRALREGLRMLGFETTYFIIPNVVDTSVFYPAKSSRKAGKFRFVHVSNLKELKNVTGIIRTAKRLYEKRQDFEVHIIGDGPDSPDLREMAKSFEILDRVVFFHGRETVSGVAEGMRNADCFILFSSYENSPCVIGESLCSGIPVIGTDVGGIPELVNERNGLLVTPGNENELLNAMEKMIVDISKYDRGQIRSAAVEKFDAEAIGEKYNLIYRSILK